MYSSQRRKASPRGPTVEDVLMHCVYTERIAVSYVCMNAQVSDVDIFNPLSIAIGNTTRPRALVQNQHAKELISARKTSHKHKERP